MCEICSVKSGINWTYSSLIWNLESWPPVLINQFANLYNKRLLLTGVTVYTLLSIRILIVLQCNTRIIDFIQKYHSCWEYIFKVEHHQHFCRFVNASVVMKYLDYTLCLSALFITTLVLCRAISDFVIIPRFGLSWNYHQLYMLDIKWVLHVL